MSVKRSVVGRSRPKRGGGGSGGGEGSLFSRDARAVRDETRLERIQVMGEVVSIASQVTVGLTQGGRIR